MPADFLMPLFVLTLLANAVLVAFAVRGMRNGQFDPDRRSPGTDRPPTVARSGPEPRSLAASGPDAVGPDLPEDIRRAIAGRRAAAVEASAAEPAAAHPVAGDPMARAVPPADLTPTVVPAPAVDLTPVVDPIAVVDPAPAARASAPARRRRPAPDPDAARPASSKRGRRRFSLPNLDDDHEKVSRSIETFLGGVDAIGGDGSTPPETAAPGTVAGGGATTVVLVAVAGLSAAAGATPFRSTSRTPRRRTVESEAAAEALALVERTLRNAARGTDIVTRDGRGRFRIVMASTGELAARAYLRRVRTTIEPGLEAAETPLRLVVALATVLDEPIEAATRRAKDRLSAMLDAAASVGRDSRATESDDSASDATSAPRAAGD